MPEEVVIPAGGQPEKSAKDASSILRSSAAAKDESEAIEKILGREEETLTTPRLAEIAGGDIAGDAVEQDMLRREKERRQERFYSDLIHAISGLWYPEKEARMVWVNLLSHKVEMSQKMGRNVGIQVAALDFFKNVVGELDQVQIIEPNLLISTARLAVTDGLTGLFNHRYFQDRLEREIRQAQDSRAGGYAKTSVVSLLMFDIDYFKVFNDLNGHIAGDVALREVAEIIRRHVKERDVVARYGGEEFAVIMAGTRKEEAAAAAERVRQEVEGTNFPNEEILPGGALTVSAGVAEFPQDATDRTGLIAYADRALYVAKRSGRNRVCAVVGDRRVSKRVAFPREVRWQALPVTTDQYHTFRCRDISLEGMGVAGDNIPEPGKIVRVYLPGAEDDPVLGQVAWRSVLRGGAAARDESVGAAVEGQGDASAPSPPSPPSPAMSAGIRFVALNQRQVHVLREATAI